LTNDPGQCQKLPARISTENHPCNGLNCLNAYNFSEAAILDALNCGQSLTKYPRAQKVKNKCQFIMLASPVMIPIAKRVRGDPTPKASQEIQQASARQHRLGDLFQRTERSLRMLAQRDGGITASGGVAHKWLRDLARWVIAENHKPELEREDQRRKNALICWFAENCQDVIAQWETKLTSFPLIAESIQPPRATQADAGSIADDEGGNDWFDLDSTE
jgi:hypothetical protein